MHLRLGALTGKYGLYSKGITKKFLREIDKIQPDIIHIHNLHKGYINIELLFNYIKTKNIPVIWTLHDCWSVTGQCPYFERVNCSKWKCGCGECPQYREYPSLIDRTALMYRIKMHAFTGVSNMTIVTPSNWLAKIVKESYLREYQVHVINNGIDLSIFKPTESDLRKKYNLSDKKVILGVASIWNSRKGLDSFIKLAKNLDDNYRLIMIGLSDAQKQNLPEKIIGFSKTKNTTELAQFYTLADVFFNPTLEDNFPTVNIEALACGTPVFTFKTGGSPECIKNGCGKVVSEDNMIEELKKWETTAEIRKNCEVEGQKYAAVDKFREYAQVYHQILNQSGG
jgi:glycosyltransferase involved in cell wall biosynthesis